MVIICVYSILAGSKMHAAICFCFDTSQLQQWQCCTSFQALKKHLLPLCITFRYLSFFLYIELSCVFSDGEHTFVFRDEQQFSKHGTGRAEGVCFKG